MRCHVRNPALGGHTVCPLDVHCCALLREGSSSAMCPADEASLRGCRQRSERCISEDLASGLSAFIEIFPELPPVFSLSHSLHPAGMIALLCAKIWVWA